MSDIPEEQKEEQTQLNKNALSRFHLEAPAKEIGKNFI